jgi:hypothetical protein
MGNPKGSSREPVQKTMLVDVSTLRISISWRLLIDWFHPADDRKKRGDEYHSDIASASRNDSDKTLRFTWTAVALDSHPLTSSH